MFLHSDIIGVVAGFVPQVIEKQRMLMLVNHTWYQGVVQQDGMKPKPGIFWPWCALRDRQPRSVVVGRMEESTMEHLLNALPSLQQLQGRGTITNAVAARIGALHQLTNLSLSSDGTSSKVSSVLQHLTDLQRLSAIQLCEFELNGDDVEFLVSKKNTTFSDLTSLEIPRERFGRLCSWRGEDLMIQLTHIAGTLRCLDVSGHFINDKGVALLVGVSTCKKHLNTLRLSSTAITDGALQHMTNLEALEVLDISECHEVTDVGIELLTAANVTQTLKELRVDQCVQLSDVGIGHIAKFHQLTTLHVGKGPAITDDGFRRLLQRPVTAASNPKGERTVLLTNLHIIETSLSEAGLQFIAEQLGVALRTLSLENSKSISTSSLEGVARHCPNLTDLKLERETATLDDSEVLDASSLAKLKSLQSLVLHRVPWTDASTKRLVLNSTKLHTFRCVAPRTTQENQITNSSLRTIATSPNTGRLRTLDLSFCKITDDGVASLVSPQGYSSLPHLTSLNLTECNAISDSGLSLIFRHLLQLKELSVQSLKKITDAPFKHVTNLQQLSSLDLCGCELLTDKIMPYLVTLNKLNNLELLDCDGISDEGLALFDGTPVAISVYY